MNKDECLENKLKGFIEIARKNPERTWDVFQEWFGRTGRDRMPCWVLERFEGEEAYIHLFDFATEAIENGVGNYCSKNNLELLSYVTGEYLPVKRLKINRAGKTLLELHNTSCSTTEMPYICVHLKTDADAVKTFLDLFKLFICKDHIDFYKKLYTHKL